MIITGKIFLRCVIKLIWLFKKVWCLLESSRRTVSACFAESITSCAGITPSFRGKICLRAWNFAQLPDRVASGWEFAPAATTEQWGAPHRCIVGANFNACGSLVIKDAGRGFHLLQLDLHIDYSRRVGSRNICASRILDVPRCQCSVHVVCPWSGRLRVDV